MNRSSNFLVEQPPLRRRAAARAERQYPSRPAESRSAERAGGKATASPIRTPWLAFPTVASLIAATCAFNFILPALLPYGPITLTSQVKVPLV